MIVLFTSLDTADLSDDDLDGSLVSLDMALCVLIYCGSKILWSPTDPAGMRISSGMWH